MCGAHLHKNTPVFEEVVKKSKYKTETGAVIKAWLIVHLYLHLFEISKDFLQQKECNPPKATVPDNAECVSFTE